MMQYAARWRRLTNDPSEHRERATRTARGGAAARGRAMIEAQRLSKRYSRGLFALRDFSLRVDKGEFVFLTGPSGAGKSTLLRLLLHQEVPSEGRLVVGGRDLSRLTVRQVQAYRRSLGFVFQDFKLLPHKTVLDNIAFVPRVLGMSAVQQQRRTFQVLKWVGLQHRMNAFPMELSGGEQQRVAIARALVNDPVIILADEPTGNLDPDLSLEIMNLFREINARGTTVLVATHDRELIRRVGRRTITLDHGQMVELT
jgi:cell division transport system ATP-binding protein